MVHRWAWPTNKGCTTRFANCKASRLDSQGCGLVHKHNPYNNLLQENGHNISHRMNSWIHRWTTTHLTGRPSSTSQVDHDMTPKRMVTTHLTRGNNTPYLRKCLVTYAWVRPCLKRGVASFIKDTLVSRTTPYLTWGMGLTHIGWPYLSHRGVITWFTWSTVLLRGITTNLAPTLAWQRVIG